MEDAGAASAEIKKLALELGADAIGIARPAPIMVREGVDLLHDRVICMLVAIMAARSRVRVQSSRKLATPKSVALSTKIAQYIRSLGYSALAHHNGA